MTRTRSIALAALTLLAGCQLTPPAPVAPPALQLMESQPLVLTPGCEASGSVVGRVHRAHGWHARTRLQLSPAPECVREALTAWVSSFRYLPPGADTPTGVEWLLVSARRGS